MSHSEASSRAEAFEHWIRTSFIQMNTALEDLYFAQDNRGAVIGCGDPIKAALRDEGHGFVAALLAEGNTGDGFESGWAPFEVLKVEKAAEKGLKVRKRGGGGEGSTEGQREELLA